MRIVNRADPSPEQQTLNLQQAIQLAVQNHTAGDLSKAEDIYQQILQVDPNHPDVLRLLGMVFHQKGEYDCAVDLFTNAVAIKPNYAKAHNNLGTVLQKLGRLDEAISHYHMALAIKSDYAEVHYNLGNVLKELGRLEEAVASYHNADIYSDSVLQFQSSEVTGSVDNPSPLLEMCVDQLSESFLKSDSGITEVLLTLARKCLDDKKFQAAIELYDEAISQDNVGELAFAGMAWAQTIIANYKAALTYLNKAAILQNQLGDRSSTTSYEPALASLNARINKPPTPTPKDIPQSAQGWYHRYAIKYPYKNQIDSNEKFNDYFLHGLIPNTPFIRRDHRIATIGSCFAAEIARYLYNKGFISSRTNSFGNIHENIFIDDDFFNTYVIREAFETAFEADFDSPNWHNDRGGIIGDKSSRAIHYNSNQIKRLLRNSDVYIITLGIAEIWYDKVNDTVFPSGLNIDEYDDTRHGFRLSTTDENLQNIERVYAPIRKHRSDASIILTLSPVALNATFRPISCVAANSVSKAVLRVAIDQLCQRHDYDDQLFYYPSYEIVKDHFTDAYDTDGRHVKYEVVKFIMDRFSDSFLIS